MTYYFTFRHLRSSQSSVFLTIGFVSYLSFLIHFQLYFNRKTLERFINNKPLNSFLGPPACPASERVDSDAPQMPKKSERSPIKQCGLEELSHRIPNMALLAWSQTQPSREGDLLSLSLSFKYERFSQAVSLLCAVSKRKGITKKTAHKKNLVLWTAIC